MSEARDVRRALRDYHRASVESVLMAWNDEDGNDSETWNFLARRLDERARQAKRLVARLVGRARARTLLAPIDEDIEELEHVYAYPHLYGEERDDFDDEDDPDEWDAYDWDSYESELRP
jgi:hypothetical protein